MKSADLNHKILSLFVRLFVGNRLNNYRQLLLINFFAKLSHLQEKENTDICRLLLVVFRE